MAWEWLQQKGTTFLSLVSPAYAMYEAGKKGELLGLVSPGYAMFKTVEPQLEKLKDIEDKIRDDTATEGERDFYNVWMPFFFPLSPLTLEKLLLLFVAVKYLQTPADRKVLAGVLTKYLDVVGKTMSALAAAGGSHPLATIVHGKIAIYTYATLGLLQVQTAQHLDSNLEAMFNKLVAKGVFSDITGIAPAIAKALT